MFNTLKYVKNLEQVGISREQAEAHVHILSEMMETNLATQQDIKNLEQKIIQSEQRMTIKLGTIVSIAIGVAVTLAKLVS